jgi:hypothetical protein
MMRPKLVIIGDDAIRGPTNKSAVPCTLLCFRDWPNEPALHSVEGIREVAAREYCSGLYDFVRAVNLLIHAFEAWPGRDLWKINVRVENDVLRGGLTYIDNLQQKFGRLPLGNLDDVTIPILRRFPWASL